MRKPAESAACIEERTLRLLSEVGEIDADTLVEEFGLHRGTAKGRLVRAHEAGWLFVTRRIRGTEGIARPVYAFGRHKDAPPLRNLTLTEYTQRYIAKLKKEGGKRLKAHIKLRRKLCRERVPLPGELAKKREYQREWKRAKGGYKPRPVKLPDVAKKDPVLARLMGVRG